MWYIYFFLLPCYSSVPFFVVSHFLDTSSSMICCCCFLFFFSSHNLLAVSLEFFPLCIF